MLVSMQIHRRLVAAIRTVAPGSGHDTRMDEEP